MPDKVKLAVASAVRIALMGKDLVSWKHEVTAISDLQTMVKVFPPNLNPTPEAPEGQTLPARYFIVQVKEQV